MGQSRHVPAAGGDLDSRAAAAREATEALRDATRAGHEMIKDLRGVVGEGRQLLEQIGPMVAEAFGGLVAEGLGEYKETLQRAIETGEERVLARFDALVASLLGEDMPPGETMEDALRRFMQRQQLLDAHGRPTVTVDAPDKL